ncbi:MAG: hypothetical protein Q9188_006531 [Gyalolechia gomerana]
MADKTDNSIASSSGSSLTPPPLSPPQPPSPTPRKRRRRATYNTPRHYASPKQKLRWVQEHIQALGWSFTDLLNQYTEQQKHPDFRTFWLQYRRHACRPDLLDSRSIQKIMKEGGVDKVASFFRRELDELAKTKGFGQYVEPNPADPDVTENGSLDFITNLAPEAKSCAPFLMRFLALLSKPSHQPPHQRREVDPVPDQKTLIWASMFLYSMRRKKCNNIPRLFGLYCIHSGVKKRIVDVLSSVGLCTSYSALQEYIKGLPKNQTSLLETSAVTPEGRQRLDESLTEHPSCPGFLASEPGPADQR